MAELVPLGNRVVVERMPAEEVSTGGIVLPGSTEKPNQGVVIAVGPGRTQDDGKIQGMSVKKGEKVLFGKYAGNDVKLEGTEYLIMSEDDILGIIK